MKATAIITGDIHLRDDTPVCRTDDFFEAMNRKIEWLKELQRVEDCPILDAGDLFAKSKPSHHLMQWAIKSIPKDFLTVPGNHDLPAHNIDLIDRSGIGVLRAAQSIEVLLGEDVWELEPGLDVHPFPWGVPPRPILRNRDQIERVALCHVMTYQGESPWPGCTDLDAMALLKKMVGFKLVITGHNHKPFIEEFEGRKLINPGSLMRSSASQADYQPHVYLWYAEDNHLEAIPVPIEKDVVSREHIEAVKERDGRIDAFVTRLNSDFDISLSYEKNLEEFFGSNRVRKGVEDIVWAAVKGEEA